MLQDPTPFPPSINLVAAADQLGAAAASHKSAAAAEDELRRRQERQAQTDYLTVARDLPRPTAAQTARFAAHVADAHSWYKHLPLYPRTPFFFILDPTAGMKFQGGREGTPGHFVEETDPDGIHYTHMTTRVYREKFGFWKYHVDNGAELLAHLKGVGARERDPEKAQPNTNIRGVAGETLTIPPDLMMRGAALLSAFVSPVSSIQLWLDNKPMLVSTRPYTFATTLERAPEELPQSLRFVWAVLHTQGWYPLRDYNHLTQNRPYRDSFCAGDLPFHCWHNEEFLLQKARELGGEQHYPDALLAAEIVQTVTSRGQAVRSELGDRHDAPPGAVVQELIDHLVRERIQQLEDMSAAMGRYLEALGEPENASGPCPIVDPSTSSG